MSESGPANATEDGDVDMASLASLVGERSRSKILMALADGRALPASLLASEAGVSRSAASTHLAKLVKGGLIVAESAGRHRYYRLSGPNVADLVEALARLAPAEPIRSLRQGTKAQALRAGRTCYDHLAGGLGVAITEALLECGALVSNQAAGAAHGAGARPAGPLASSPYQLGYAADEVFERLGIHVASLRRIQTRRPLLKFCVDWSEQRPHLAGLLGASLASTLIDNEWIRRRSQYRAVILTDRGAAGLATIGYDP